MMTQPMTIYLASKSPRRKELLELMDVAFKILSLDTPEIVKPNETPEAYSKRITQEKLHAAWKNIIDEGLEQLPVLCADTEVVLDEQILGKPQDKNAAFHMIKQYAGKTHRVITSVGLIYGQYEKICTNTTWVTFSEMSDDEILHYLNQDNYKDKAGGYAIQSYIGQFITAINGCFYSVMGLPLNTVRAMINELAESLQSC